MKEERFGSGIQFTAKGIHVASPKRRASRSEKRVFVSEARPERHRGSSFAAHTGFNLFSSTASAASFPRPPLCQRSTQVCTRLVHGTPILINTATLSLEENTVIRGFQDDEVLPGIH